MVDIYGTAALYQPVYTTQHCMNGGLTGAHIVTAAPAPRDWTPIIQFTIYNVVARSVQSHRGILNVHMAWIALKRKGRGLGFSV